jgi:hypothetical protein
MGLRDGDDVADPAPETLEETLGDDLLKIGEFFCCKI